MSWSMSGSPATGGAASAKRTTARRRVVSLLGAMVLVMLGLVGPSSYLIGAAEYESELAVGS